METLSEFKEYVDLVENQTGCGKRHVKIIRSDNGFSGSNHQLVVGFLLLISMLYHMAIARAMLIDAFTSN